MQIQNKALLNLDGQPLREQKQGEDAPADDAPIITVSKILERAALAPSLTQTPFTDKQNAARFEAAVYLHKLEIAVPFELDRDLVSELTTVIMRAYPPLIAGQMVPILEGK